jgi:hypothetical protein
MMSGAGAVRSRRDLAGCSCRTAARSIVMRSNPSAVRALPVARRLVTRCVSCHAQNCDVLAPGIGGSAIVRIDGPSGAAEGIGGSNGPEGR